MRVLFTTLPQDGHFHPLVPVAAAAQAAGHEVAFAAPASFAPRVERAGFRAFPAGSDVTPRDFEQTHPDLARVMASLKGDALTEFLWQHVAVEVFAASMVSDLLALSETWLPDLIVRSQLEFGGCIAAERLGIPHAAIQTVAFDPHLDRLIDAPLNRLRASIGLPPVPAAEMLYGHLFLTTRPPSLQDPSVPLPSTARPVRPVPFDQSGEEELPTWMSELAGQPIIYITLGTTIANERPEIFATLIEALRDDPVNIVVTVGRNQDPAQFGAQPANVHIERYIPQTLLFPRCDLVISHGGSGTVMAALACGLPMLLIPLAADQPDNAVRCATLGVAQVLDPEDLSVKTAREAARSVLREEGYRRQAQRLREEIARMPGPEQAVRLLERLVARPSKLAEAYNRGDHAR
jgi:UDP:flavonoid glycosyltransferase YjiC (YdhE family)